jgi:hypothetical protein
MVVTGEQGTAKSTRSAMLRSVVDPSKPKLRALPRDERDLVISARNRLVLAFDNVSGLKWWLSDACCRIASGAGFGTRQLYTDTDEIVFEGARPQIFNGIEDIVDRPDFAERSIFSVCEVIAGKDRLEEEEIWAAFDQAHPSILGALLDAVVEGLNRFPGTRPPVLPRMADFAHWAIACETALWDEGAFITAYNANILSAVESVLEASPVAGAVRAFMANRTQWQGTSTALLVLLTTAADKRVSESEHWPDNGRALSGRLRRAASFLRHTGIQISFAREAHTGTRLTTITKVIPSGAGQAVRGASPSSPPSPDSRMKNGDGGDGGDGNQRPSPPAEGGSLLSAIVAYMAKRAEVSAPPRQLFAVLNQPIDDDVDAMASQLKAIEGALARYRIMMSFDRGWVVLESAVRRRRLWDDG